MHVKVLQSVRKLFMWSQIVWISNSLSLNPGLRCTMCTSDLHRSWPFVRPDLHRLRSPNWRNCISRRIRNGCIRNQATDSRCDCSEIGGTVPLFQNTNRHFQWISTGRIFLSWQVQREQHLSTSFFSCFSSSIKRLSERFVGISKR